MATLSCAGLRPYLSRLDVRRVGYIGMHCQVGAISKRPRVSWRWFVPLTSAY